MRPAWVAGAVRAQLLARRRLGVAGAREVAAAGSVEAALQRLATSTYAHDLRSGMDLRQARHALRATALWHLRVLAGWLAPKGAEGVRLLAGGHEIDNIEARLIRLAVPEVPGHELPGTEAPGAELPGTESPGDEPAFQLGALATAWPAVQRAGSAVQVREALRASAWGDPGDGGVAELGAALRLAWSGRLAEGLPPARRWATAAAAVVVARERFAHRRNLTPPALADARRLIGRAWEPAPTVALFAAALAPDCRWPLEGVGDSTDLWQAESKWWRTVDREAERLSARAGTGEEAVAAAGMLLLADAWRAGAALEAAGWGAAGVEVFDAVA